MQKRIIQAMYYYLTSKRSGSKIIAIVIVALSISGCGIKITSPPDNSEYVQGVQIELKARRMLGASSVHDFEWNSSIDGNLGTGDDLIIPDLSVGRGPLSEGNHVIQAEHPGLFSWHSWKDNVSLTVSPINEVLTANAGPDKHVSFNDEVILDGSASSDPEDSLEDLTFEWMQVGGTEVELTGADTAIASFTAPENVESMGFRLRVTNRAGATATDYVVVTVFEDLSNAIFVSSRFGDNNNPGTMEEPVRTLIKAQRLSRECDPRADVYVHNGNYYPVLLLVITDDVSLYGGFQASKVGEVVQGWTRFEPPPNEPPSQTRTYIARSRTVLLVQDISSSTTIDGFFIQSHAGAVGGTVPGVCGSSGVCGHGFFIRNWSQFDVDGVWLVHGEDGVEVKTLVTPNLSVAYPCGTAHPDYNDEIPVNVPKLHDPSEEPDVTPTHLFEYKQERICSGDTHLYYDYLIDSHAFAPGIVHFLGHTLVRETMFIFDAAGYRTSHVRFEQVTRGPDGQLYTYQPVWREGPSLLAEKIAGGYGAYDLIDEGTSGFNSIGIYVHDSSGNLHITNNTIIAGEEGRGGGAGGDGGDGGDGNLGGNGGDGGDSIGIFLINASPTIQGNHIVTAAGGDGGDGGSGAVGGNGGASCGIYKEGDSWPLLGSNTYDIGPGGQGGNPSGEDGLQGNLCTP